MSELRNVPAAVAAAAADSKSAEPVLRVARYHRMANEPELRVATYRRASPDEGNRPYSLDAQERRLRPYIASHPGWVEVGDYVERASAKDNTSRPQLQQLLRDAASGNFDLVLVANIDRWSRNLADLLDTIAFLGEHGVAFHSVTEHFHTTNPKGKMTL
jgi:site-specific DNA recombinase